MSPVLAWPPDMLPHMQEEDLSLIETHVGLLGEYTEVPHSVCRVPSARGQCFLSPYLLRVVPLCLPSPLCLPCFGRAPSLPAPFPPGAGAGRAPERVGVKNEKKALCFHAPSPTTI